MTTTGTESRSFMLLLRGGVSNRDLSPDQMQQQIGRYMNWIEKLRRDGHFVAGEPLDETGKVLSGKNGTTITDGPFTESKEEVGGYFIIRAQDLKHAVEISKGCPIFVNNGTVEVRAIQPVPGL
jgi:hypothetical protein